MMEQKLLVCLTNSQVHVGVGQALDTIDLPIHRERMTGWPLIPGTALKGVLRDHFKHNEHIDYYFGAGSNESDQAGVLGFPDLNVLGFPVRCLEKGFVLITCPKVLKRFAKHLSRCQGHEELKKALNSIPACDNDQQIYGQGSDKKLHLEEFELVLLENQQQWNSIVEQVDILTEEIESEAGSMMMVSDRLFHYFVNHATEVQARIAIDDQTGTVKAGALFYEEYLPSDTLMYGVMSMEYARPKRIGDKPLRFTDFCQAAPKFIQIGGGFTTGKGIVELLFCEGGNHV